MSESAQQILKTYLEMPAGFWVKVLIATVVLLVLFTILKKLAQVGQVIGVLLVIIIMGIIVCKWVRDRDEPPFMTPAVDFVSSFFPARASAAPASGAPAPVQPTGTTAPVKTPAKQPAK